MPSVEAVIGTDRATRYVEQLSRHFAHEPGGMRVLSQSPGELVVDLGGASWRTRAEQGGLVLRVEAGDAARLDDVSARVKERIEQIGRRDGLQVHWESTTDELQS
jgi:hypothetical protein